MPSKRSSPQFFYRNFQKHGTLTKDTKLRHVQGKVCQILIRTVRGGFEDNQVRNQILIRTGAHDHEVEAAVGRGKSKYGVVMVRGTERTFKKTNFRWPQVEQQSPIARRPSSAARQLKVARPQPRSPAPRSVRVQVMVVIAKLMTATDRDRGSLRF